LLVGAEDLDSYRVAYDSDAFWGEGYADDVFAGVDLDFESFVQAYCYALVLGTGGEGPGLAVDCYGAGPAVPLAVELDFGHFQFMCGPKGKSPLASVSYIEFEGRGPADGPGSAVRAKPALQALDRFAPGRLGPGAFVLIGPCERGLAALAGEQDGQHHQQGVFFQACH